LSDPFENIVKMPLSFLFRKGPAIGRMTSDRHVVQSAHQATLLPSVIV